MTNVNTIITFGCLSVLKTMLLFSLLFISTSNVAQVSDLPSVTAVQEDSKIKKLEKEMSFKIITFSVSGINTPDDASQLKNLLESKNGILSCETDINNKTCTLIASFAIQRKDVVGITGPAGIKK